MTFLCTWNNPFPTHIDLIPKAVEGSDCKTWQPADRRLAAMGTPAPQVQRERELDAPICVLHFGCIVLLLTLAFLLPFLTGTSQTCSSLLRPHCFSTALYRLFLLSLRKAGSQLLSFTASACCAPPVFTSGLSWELFVFASARFLCSLSVFVHLSVFVSLSLCLSLLSSVSLCSFVSLSSVSLSLCFLLCFLLCCAQLLSHV